MKKFGFFLIILFSGFITFAPLLFVFVVPVIVSALEEETPISNSNGFVVCNETQPLNIVLFNQQMNRAGVLASHGSTFIESAYKYNIDPILFVAIAMHETGWGTSNAVVNHNNPGGLMDPATNWTRVIRFSTLEEGIEAMARTLNKWINEEGKVTIDELGAIYAPVGAENDPNGLNKNWIPRVTEYINDFGGLTMNCEVMGHVELIGDKAWITPHTKNITSHYRTPHRPNHNGIDIASAGINGTPVVAFMDGEVIYSQYNSGGYGNLVIIDHGNGMETRYAHLLEQGIPVGSMVKAGETIGRVGSTGRSTGPHLHFEVLINGTHIDPMTVLNEFLTE